jgi:aldehyde dehydrogenase (NAD+)
VLVQLASAGEPGNQDELIDLVRTRGRALRVGPGRNDPDLGPLVSAEQYAKVTGYIEAGLREGASLVFGGGRPEHLNRGFFVEPTLFEQVDPDMRIAREEIFGPVATMTTFESEDRALAIANSLGYGLSAGVYTRDISRALRLAQRLEAGSV